MHHQSQLVTSHEQSQHKMSAAKPALPCLPVCLTCLPLDIFTALPICWTYLLPACLTQHITMHHQSQAVTSHKWSHQWSQHKTLAGHTTQGPGLPCLACLPAIFTALLAFHIFTALLAFLLTYLLPCLPAFSNMSQFTTGHKQSQAVTLHEQSHWPSQPKTLAGHKHPILNIYLIILIYIIFFTI